MGMQNNTLICLMYVIKKYGIDVSRFLTIGQQNLSADIATIRKVFDYYDLDYTQNELQKFVHDKFINDFARKVWGYPIYSLDVSAYEGADIIHDLNKPILADEIKPFSCIFDGGSSEHIFNVKQVFENYKHLLKVGGYIIHVLPTNFQNGHGLYQFSPEFFTSFYKKENGFELLDIFFLQYINQRYVWRLEVHKWNWRLMYNPAVPTNIFVVAKKISEIENEISLQQSDYEKMWKGQKSAKSYQRIKKMIPQKLYYLLHYKFVLPIKNTKYLKRISINQLLTK